MNLATRLRGCFTEIADAEHQKLYGKLLLEAADELDAKERSLSDSTLRIAELEGHIGKDPSLERILEGHSYMTREGFYQGHGAVLHRPYKQGHDERCYLCSLIAQIELMECEVRRANMDAEAKYAPSVEYAGQCAAILRDARDCLFDGNWDRIAVRHLVARIDALSKKFTSGTTQPGNRTLTDDSAAGSGGEKTGNDSGSCPIGSRPDATGGMQQGQMGRKLADPVGESTLTNLIAWLDAKGAASNLVANWGTPGLTFRQLVEEYRSTLAPATELNGVGNPK